MVQKLIFKKGEAKDITFISKTDGFVNNVSAAVGVDFIVTQRYGSTVLISKTITDFDLTQGNCGIMKVNLSETDLTLNPGTYKAELKTTFTAVTDIDKSEELEFIIQDSLF